MTALGAVSKLLKGEGRRLLDMRLSQELDLHAVRNCASGNREIPGSRLRAPRNG